MSSEDTADERARIASELRVVVGRLVRRLRAAYTLPSSHLAVLARLDREGAQTASALAASERVRPQSIAQTVSELEVGGLVARRPDPADRRQALVELTHAGATVLADDRARRESWLAEVIGRELSPTELQRLAEAVALLGRIADA